MNRSALIIVVLLVLFSCKTKQVHVERDVETSVSNISIENDSILLGIDVLKKSNFEFLKGKKVGLVTNLTGVDNKLNLTLDILNSSDEVNLVALFSPEHGVRGNFSAGDAVGNYTDPQTGLPVYSLYGKNKRPTKEQLDGIDVLIYDIQDVGVRSYTYISTMGEVMEAAAQYDKEVLVLDRPNPLGGERVEGPLVHDGYFSFVSKFRIPYIYGMTCGELALFINNEGLLEDGVHCNLMVLKMEGWHRDMTFDKTGLVWIPPSPHIPTWQTAFYYAATGIIGELDPNMIGIGYTLPFQTLVTDDIDAQRLAESMNRLNLEGVIFRPVYYKPYYMSKKGKQLQGVQIHITDYNTVNLTEIQFYFLQEAHKLNPEFNPFKGKENRYRMFDYGCGSDIFRKSLMRDFNFDELKELWQADVDRFREVSSNYYLYEGNGTKNSW